VTSTVRGGAGSAVCAGVAPRWRFCAAWRVMLSASAIELHDEPATRAHETASRSRRSSSPRSTVIARSASSGSSLLTARRSGVPLTVVVVNNDGGGIFSFLPIAQAEGAKSQYEALWGTQSFYRAMSTVNGGRAKETDLFEGIRE